MKQLHANEFFKQFSMFAEILAYTIIYKDDKLISGAPGLTGPTLETVKELRAGCLTLGMRASVAGVDRLCLALAKDNATFGDIRRLVEELHTRMLDEMNDTRFIALDYEASQYFATPNLFGEEVAARFPSAITDIEEAGKCLAFGRATASVFHLMRVMEVGLKQLAADLGVPYAPSWESYITQINSRISDKPRRKGVRWKRDEPYFSDLLGELTAIKVAWRNPTMHVRRKYTPEEASDIFSAVRTLMQRLAARNQAKTTQ